MNWAYMNMCLNRNFDIIASEVDLNGESKGFNE